MSRHRCQTMIVTTARGDVPVKVYAALPMSPGTREALAAVARCVIENARELVRVQLHPPIPRPEGGGDVAEYYGPSKTLRGARCVVHQQSRTGKRVRVIARVNGHLVERFVRADNLKRLGGGVLESEDEG